MNTRTILSAALLGLVLLLSVTTVAGAGVRARASLSDIEGQVMCPVCHEPLSVADSPQAQRERVFIKRLIARGESTAQIKDALVTQYGPEVLALPREQGFNLAVYLVPIAALLAALLVLAALLPRWRKRRRDMPQSGPDAKPLSAADARRLDEDLAHYDP